MRIKSLLIGWLAVGVVSPVMAAGVTAPGFSTVTDTTAGTVWQSSPALNGYIAELSTAADFSGTLISSFTADNGAQGLVVSSLSPNTTYYGRIGAITAGTTTYVPTAPA